jgi:hypothetical protein
MAMRFDSASYGPEVASILALGRGSCDRARQILKSKTAESLFPMSASPQGAMAGLWLYFSCFDEAHGVAQNLETQEGSFWHGILHREEPDAANAAYWFRRVGQHPVFPVLRDAAEEILNAHSVSFRVQDTWNPTAFIDFCETARQEPASEAEKVAMEIRNAEWQILFEHCARPKQ